MLAETLPDYSFSCAYIKNPPYGRRIGGAKKKKQTCHKKSFALVAALQAAIRTYTQPPIYIASSLD